MARYCRACGRELDNGARFCTECGTAAEPSTPTAPPSNPGTNPARQASPKSATRRSTIALVCAIVALLVVVFMAMRPGIIPGGAPSSQPASSTSAPQANTQEQEKAEQEAAKAEKEAAVEKDKQRALEANPKVVHSTPSSQISTRAGITGTIRVHNDVSSITNKTETICVMELPNELTVDGTQYGSISSSNIIVNDKFAEYDGEVITLDAQFIVESSASYPEAKYTPIWASNETFVRDYRI